MEHVPETDQQAQARMQQARCRNCLFSAPGVGLPGGKLECHFKPPAISGFTWPAVSEMDWCGEFIIKAPA